MTIDFKSVFDSAPGLYLVLDTEFNILGVTDAYLRATLTKREAILGKNLFDVFPDNPDEPAATGTSNLRASLKRVLKNRAPDKMPTQKYDVPRPPEAGGGFEEKYWDPTNFPVLDADGEIAYIIHCVKDVTDAVRSNCELRRSQAEIGNLEEERALRERFVATLSHDLKNPLTAMKMSAMLIGRSIDNPVKITSLADKIVDGINRTEKMINNLLDANRIKAGQKLNLDIEKFNFTQYVQEIARDLVMMYGDRFDLEPGENVEGYWSADGIRRILENLTANAVKYGEPDGRIRIKVKTRNSHRVVISVHNFGAPLRAEDFETIFEEFRRGSSESARKQKGWGLGLTLVKGIAEAHGGYVSVESAPEIGTTFFVTLPRDCRKSQAA